MTDRLTTPLLELDPDLGQLLPEERLSAARRELRVAVRTLETGPWDVDRLSGASPEHVGLLVLDGVFAARCWWRTRSAPSCSAPATWSGRGRCGRPQPAPARGPLERAVA